MIRAFVLGVETPESSLWTEADAQTEVDLSDITMLLPPDSPVPKVGDRFGNYTVAAALYGGKVVVLKRDEDDAA